MTLPQELVEREMGKTVLNLLGDVVAFETVSKAAQSTAVQALGKIQAALSDPSLDDFQYIEAIVDILHHYGISTSCHDF